MAPGRPRGVPRVPPHPRPPLVLPLRRDRDRPRLLPDGAPERAGAVGPLRGVVCRGPAPRRARGPPPAPVAPPARRLGILARGRVHPAPLVHGLPAFPGGVAPPGPPRGPPRPPRPHRAPLGAL